MAVTLTPVRYFTQDSMFHYTTENMPLLDLSANDTALKTAVDSAVYDQQTLTNVNWGSGPQLSLPTTQETNGKAFCWMLDLYIIEDPTVAVGSLKQAFLKWVGVAWKNGGSVSFNNSNIIQSQYVGFSSINIFTGSSGTNLTLTINGASGTNGVLGYKWRRFQG